MVSVERIEAAHDRHHPNEMPTSEMPKNEMPKNEMTEIVVTGRIPDAGLDLLADVGNVWAWTEDEPIPTDVLHARLSDARAVVTLLSDHVDTGFLDAAPNVEVVANVAVGYNNIDVDACTARGVRVTNTPGVLTDATADLAVGLLLAVTRRLGEGERLIRSGTPWEWGMFMMLGTGLRGRRLGIVGMGEIGVATATRARAFGMEIVYHNRSRAASDVERRLEARYVPLDEVFATSDVVSLHCPYSPETHHLVDENELASMKSSAYLVNTARGPIVHEAALVAALTNGTVAGAALDVYEHEPQVDPGLLDLDNVVLAPHLGSATVETRTAMAELAARNVVAVLRGDDPPTPVN